MLQVKPVEELKSLRHDPVKHDSISLFMGEEKLIDSISSACMEIKMTMISEPGRSFGLKLLCSPDKREETVITYDGKTEAFVVNFEHASLNTTLRYPENSWNQIIPYVNRKKELKLDIFVDRSVIEIFVNDDICIVQRVYPTMKGSTQVRFFSLDAEVQFRNITKWEMDAANPW